MKRPKQENQRKQMPLQCLYSLLKHWGVELCPTFSPTHRPIKSTPNWIWSTPTRYHSVSREHGKPTINSIMESYSWMLTVRMLQSLKDLQSQLDSVRSDRIQGSLKMAAFNHGIPLFGLSLYNVLKQHVLTREPMRGVADWQTRNYTSPLNRLAAATASDPSSWS